MLLDFFVLSKAFNARAAGQNAVEVLNIAGPAERAIKLRENKTRRGLSNGGQTQKCKGLLPYRGIGDPSAPVWWT